MTMDSPIIDIGLGVDHACALGRDGTVRCWGRRGIVEHGLLGDEILPYTSIPVRVR